MTWGAAAVRKVMLLSVHIPKCAGTSFHLLLRARFGPGLCLNYGTAFHRGEAEKLPVPGDTACIHGHYLADTFAERFPAAMLVTWLRDPVERVISNYYHFLRAPDMRDECCRKLHEENLSVREFAELHWMRNTMSRYLAGHALDDFAAIGIAERSMESLLGMRSRLGWNNADEVLPRVNVNPGRTAPGYPIDADTRDFLERLNEADREVYERARERLIAVAPLISVAA